VLGFQQDLADVQAVYFYFFMYLFIYFYLEGCSSHLVWQVQLAGICHQIRTFSPFSMLYSMASCGQPRLFPFLKEMKEAPSSREGAANKACMNIAFLASKKSGFN